MFEETPHVRACFELFGCGPHFFQLGDGRWRLARYFLRRMMTAVRRDVLSDELLACMPLDAKSVSFGRLFASALERDGCASVEAVEHLLRKTTSIGEGWFSDVERWALLHAWLTHLPFKKEAVVAFERLATESAVSGNADTMLVLDAIAAILEQFGESCWRLGPYENSTEFRHARRRTDLFNDLFDKLTVMISE